MLPYDIFIYCEIIYFRWPNFRGFMKMGTFVVALTYKKIDANSEKTSP